MIIRRDDDDKEYVYDPYAGTYETKEDYDERQIQEAKQDRYAQEMSVARSELPRGLTQTAYADSGLDPAMRIPQDAPQLQEQPTSGGVGDFFSAFGKGAVSGAAGVAKGAAGLFGQNAVTDFMDDVMRNNAPTKQHEITDWESFKDYLFDPSGLTYAAGNLAGSMAALAPFSAIMPARLAALAAKPATWLASKGLVKGASGLTKGLADKVISLGGGAASGLAKDAAFKLGQERLGRYVLANMGEALTEAGNVNAEMAQEGRSMDDRVAASLMTFTANALTLPMTSAFEGLLAGSAIMKTGAKAGESLLKRLMMAIPRATPEALTGAFVNGVEEVLQQTYSDGAQGKKVGNLFDPNTWTKEQSNSFRDGFFGSLAFSGIGGTVGNLRAPSELETNEEGRTFNHRGEEIKYPSKEQIADDIEKVCGVRVPLVDISEPADENGELSDKAFGFNINGIPEEKREAVISYLGNIARDNEYDVIIDRGIYKFSQNNGYSFVERVQNKWDNLIEEAEKNGVQLTEDTIRGMYDYLDGVLQRWDRKKGSPTDHLDAYKLNQQMYIRASAMAEDKRRGARQQEEDEIKQVEETESLDALSSIVYDSTRRPGVRMAALNKLNELHPLPADIFAAMDDDIRASAKDESEEREAVSEATAEQADKKSTPAHRLFADVSSKDKIYANAREKAQRTADGIAYKVLEEADGDYEKAAEKVRNTVMKSFTEATAGKDEKTTSAEKAKHAGIYDAVMTSLDELHRITRWYTAVAPVDTAAEETPPERVETPATSAEPKAEETPVIHTVEPKAEEPKGKEGKPSREDEIVKNTKAHVRERSDVQMEKAIAHPKSIEAVKDIYRKELKERRELRRDIISLIEYIKKYGKRDKDNVAILKDFLNALFNKQSSKEVKEARTIGGKLDGDGKELTSDDNEGLDKIVTLVKASGKVAEEETVTSSADEKVEEVVKVLVTPPEVTATGKDEVPKPAGSKAQTIADALIKACGGDRGKAKSTLELLASKGLLSDVKEDSIKEAIDKSSVRGIKKNAVSFLLERCINDGLDKNEDAENLHTMLNNFAHEYSGKILDDLLKALGIEKGSHNGLEQSVLENAAAVANAAISEIENFVLREDTQEKYLKNHVADEYVKKFFGTPKEETPKEGTSKEKETEKAKAVADAFLKACNGNKREAQDLANILMNGHLIDGLFTILCKSSVRGSEVKAEDQENEAVVYLLNYLLDNGFKISDGVERLVKLLEQGRKEFSSKVLEDLLNLLGIKEKTLTSVEDKNFKDAFDKRVTEFSYDAANNALNIIVDQLLNGKYQKKLLEKYAPDLMEKFFPKKGEEDGSEKSIVTKTPVREGSADPSIEESSEKSRDHREERVPKSKETITKEVSKPDAKETQRIADVIFLYAKTNKEKALDILNKINATYPLANYDELVQRLNDLAESSRKVLMEQTSSMQSMVQAVFDAFYPRLMEAAKELDSTKKLPQSKVAEILQETTMDMDIDFEEAFAKAFGLDKKADAKVIKEMVDMYDHVIDRYAYNEIQKAYLEGDWEKFVSEHLDKRSSPSLSDEEKNAKIEELKVEVLDKAESIFNGQPEENKKAIYSKAWDSILEAFPVFDSTLLIRYLSAFGNASDDELRKTLTDDYLAGKIDIADALNVCLVHIAKRNILKALELGDHSELDERRKNFINNTANEIIRRAKVAVNWEENKNDPETNVKIFNHLNEQADREEQRMLERLVELVDRDTTYDADGLQKFLNDAEASVKLMRENTSGKGDAGYYTVAKDRLEEEIDNDGGGDGGAGESVVTHEGEAVSTDIGERTDTAPSETVRARTVRDNADLTRGDEEEALVPKRKAKKAKTVEEHLEEAQKVINEQAKGADTYPSVASALRNIAGNIPDDGSEESKNAKKELENMASALEGRAAFLGNPPSEERPSTTQYIIRVDEDGKYYADEVEVDFVDAVDEITARAGRIKDGTESLEDVLDWFDVLKEDGAHTDPDIANQYYAIDSILRAAYHKTFGEEFSSPALLHPDLAKFAKAHPKEVVEAATSMVETDDQLTDVESAADAAMGDEKSTPLEEELLTKVRNGKETVENSPTQFRELSTYWSRNLSDILEANDMATIKAETDRLAKQNKEADDRIEKAKKEIAELEAKSKELDAKKAEMDADDRIEKAKKEIAELEAKNKELAAKKAEMDAEMAKLKAEKTELEASSKDSVVVPPSEHLEAPKVETTPEASTTSKAGGEAERAGLKAASDFVDDHFEESIERTLDTSFIGKDDTNADVETGDGGIPPKGDSTLEGGDKGSHTGLGAGDTRRGKGMEGERVPRGAGGPHDSSDVEREDLSGEMRDESGAGESGRGEVAPLVQPVSDRAKEKSKYASSAKDGNLVITDPVKFYAFAPNSKGVLTPSSILNERYERNIEALNILANLRDSGRKATFEEQVALALYSGWGGFGSYLFKGSHGTFEKEEGKWGERALEIRRLLSKLEWETAQRSSATAFFTSPSVTSSIWNLLKNTLSIGKNSDHTLQILEPSMGIGNFLGVAPSDISSKAQFHGFELDKTSAEMAQFIYPSAAIQNASFEAEGMPKNFYDVVIGNFPFSGDRYTYGLFNPVLHDYFLLKCMDKLKPGGIMAVVTSIGTMDKGDAAIRNEIASKADLLGVIRLPAGTFADTNTSCNSDILLFRKRTAPNLHLTQTKWTSSNNIDSAEIVTGTTKSAKGETVELTTSKTYTRNAIFGKERKEVSLGEEAQYEVSDAVVEDGVVTSPAVVIPGKGANVKDKARFGGTSFTAVNSLFGEGTTTQNRIDIQREIITKAITEVLPNAIEGIGSKEGLNFNTNAVPKVSYVSKIKTDGRAEAGTLIISENLKKLLESAPDAKQFGERYAATKKEWEASHPYGPSWEDSCLIVSDGRMNADGTVGGRSVESAKAWTVKNANDMFNRVSQVRDYLKIADCLARTLDAERSFSGDSKEFDKKIKPLREELRKAYFDFLEKYCGGKDHVLADAWIYDLLKRINEASLYKVASLVKKTVENGKTVIIYSDLLNPESTATVRSIQAEKAAKGDINLAIMISRNRSEKLDVSEIAKLSGISEKKVRRYLTSERVVKNEKGEDVVLRPLALTNAFGDLEYADSFLSGKVSAKLRECQAALASGVPYRYALEQSIAALKKALPPRVKFTSIKTINLGASWIPQDITTDFIFKILWPTEHSTLHGKEREEFLKKNLLITNYNGKYKISVIGDPPTKKTYTVSKKIGCEQILNNAFNMQPFVYKAGGGSELEEQRRKEAVIAANNIIEGLRDTFNAWLWQSPERRMRLEDAYNEILNGIVPPEYDGSFLSMPGMALKLGTKDFNLRAHQKNVIYRGLIAKRGLYAHAVGTGKTFAIAGLAMESRRYGISKKPLIFAHNSNAQAVYNDFMTMYPSARVLYVPALKDSPFATPEELQNAVDKRAELQAKLKETDKELAPIKAEIAKLKKKQGEVVEKEKPKVVHYDAKGNPDAYLSRKWEDLNNQIKAILRSNAEKFENRKALAAEINKISNNLKGYDSQQDLLTRAVIEDWDAVIIPHSLVTRLNFKADTVASLAASEIARYESMITTALPNFTQDDFKARKEYLDKVNTLTEKMRAMAAKIENEGKVIAEKKKSGASRLELETLEAHLREMIAELDKTRKDMESIPIPALVSYLERNSKSGDRSGDNKNPIMESLTEWLEQRDKLADEVDKAYAFKNKNGEGMQSGRLFFEDAGFDLIIVDEAHEFKKPPFITTLDYLPGIQTSTSQSAQDMFLYAKYMNMINDGSGVHLFTGTPLTNTITEFYHMMRYIMPNEMAENHIIFFDDWAKNFIDVSPEVYFKFTGKSDVRVNASNFKNMRQLRMMVSPFMDVYDGADSEDFAPRKTEDGKLLSDDDLSESERDYLENGYTDDPKGLPYLKVIVEKLMPSSDQQEINRMINEATEKWLKDPHRSQNDPGAPFVATHNRNQMAHDPRFYCLDWYKTHPMPADNKSIRAAKKFFEILLSCNKRGLTPCQLFLLEEGRNDYATRKDKNGNEFKVPAFNFQKDIIETIKSLGREMGIPITDRQIGIVDGSNMMPWFNKNVLFNDYKSEKELKAHQKELGLSDSEVDHILGLRKNLKGLGQAEKTARVKAEIAAMANRGDLLAVFGSPESVGTGVNMQARLRAIHHLDAPWMPGLLVQAIGRGKRQGNMWNTVLDIRYITQGMENMKWSALVHKQRMIDILMVSDWRNVPDEIDVTSDTDEDNDMIATYRAAAGDMRPIRQATLDRKVKSMVSQKMRYAMQRDRALKTLRDADSDLKAAKNDLEAAENDQRFYAKLRAKKVAFFTAYIKWYNENVKGTSAANGIVTKQKVEVLSKDVRDARESAEWSERFSSDGLETKDAFEYSAKLDTALKQAEDELHIDERISLAEKEHHDKRLEELKKIKARREKAIAKVKEIKATPEYQELAKQYLEYAKMALDTDDITIEDLVGEDQLISPLVAENTPDIAIIYDEYRRKRIISRHQGLSPTLFGSEVSRAIMRDSVPSLKIEPEHIEDCYSFVAVIEGTKVELAQIRPDMYSRYLSLALHRNTWELQSIGTRGSADGISEDYRTPKGDAPQKGSVYSVPSKIFRLQSSGIAERIKECQHKIAEIEASVKTARDEAKLSFPDDARLQKASSELAELLVDIREHPNPPDSWLADGISAASYVLIADSSGKLRKDRYSMENVYQDGDTYYCLVVNNRTGESEYVPWQIVYSPDKERLYPDTARVYDPEEGVWTEETIPPSPPYVPMTSNERKVQAIGNELVKMNILNDHLTEAKSDDQLVAEALSRLLEKLGIKVIRDYDDFVQIIKKSGLGAITMAGDKIHYVAHNDLGFFIGALTGLTSEGSNIMAINPMSSKAGETAIHEYVHVWDYIIKKYAPALWKRGLEILKATPEWEEIADPLSPYAPFVQGNEFKIATEVHAALVAKHIASDFLKRFLETDGHTEGKAEAMLDEVIERFAGDQKDGTLSFNDAEAKWLEETAGVTRDILSSAGAISEEEAKGMTLLDFLNFPMRDLELAGTGSVAASTLIKAIREMKGTVGSKNIMASLKAPRAPSSFQMSDLIAPEKESTATRVKNNPKAFATSAWESFMINWVDKNYNLGKIDNLYAQHLGTKLRADQTLRDKANMINANADGIAWALVHGDANSIEALAKMGDRGFKLPHKMTLQMVIDNLMQNGSTKWLDTKYNGYLKSIGAKTWIDALDTYLAANRIAEAREIWGIKYTKMPIPLSQVKEIIHYAPPEIKKAAEDYYKLQENILALARQGNLLSAADATMFNARFRRYCPLNRDFTDMGEVDKFFSDLNVSRASGVVNVGKVFFALDQTGSERKIKPPLTSTLKQIACIAEKVERNRVGLYAVKAAKETGIGFMIERPDLDKPDPAHQIITVMANGKKHAYQVLPEFYMPLVGYNTTSSQMLFGWMETAASMLRTGATISPSFAARNGLRDTIFAGVSSKNGFIPFVSTIKGALKLWSDPKFRALFYSSGVPMVGFTRNKNEEVLNMANTTSRNAIAQALGEGFKVAENFSAFIENATRAGEFMLALEHGKSVEEAALDAKTVTLNYNRSGTKGRTVNRYIPFFNACIQGVDKVREMFVQNPAGTSARIFSYIILPSLLLLAMQDPEERDKLSPQVKYSNWILPGGLKIPKPQEVGILFGSGIEALMDSVYAKDKQAYAEWATTVRSSLMPNIIPTLFLPMLEWVTNYSFFKGRPLVTQKYQNLPETQQFTPTTTAWSKRLGNAFNVSPIKIDNAVRNYTGTMGMLLYQVTSELVEPSGRPAKPLSESPLFRNFNVTRNNNTRNVDDFYQILSTVLKEANGGDKRAKVDATDIRKASKLISKYNAAIRENYSAKLTPEAKRVKEDEYKNKIEMIAKNIRKKYGDRYL